MIDGAKIGLALGAATLLFSGGANAATIITLNPAGSSSSATYDATTTGAFNDAFQFTALKNGIVNATIQTIGASAVTDITFDPALSYFNGSLYTYSGKSPIFEQLLKINAPVVGGAVTVFNVAGQSGSQGKYTINLSYSAAPEASTWILLVVGFGAVGASMRKARGLRSSSLA